ncbi:hypothetical protein BKA82DRAFT_335405 [Pisolithus tinctorius]|uniref:Uncharacterized protein n=1 Tax=Pisolithus tinctorius Marx 270 TaxID=870435 RepID=A0A0C3JB78_PISTI|nr:hypothetical protein BKA82DRAFT_335405 [Pisolithus tinctorius]KIN94906.1 hypothetical protein M404DRAFT_335405 [Pisolithus tinctorius Marx 270]
MNCIVAMCRSISSSSHQSAFNDDDDDGETLSLDFKIHSTQAAEIRVGSMLSVCWALRWLVLLRCPFYLFRTRTVDTHLIVCTWYDSLGCNVHISLRLFGRTPRNTDKN